jgi:hypothetical protein
MAQGAGLESQDLGGPARAFDAAVGMIQDMGDMLALGIVQADRRKGIRRVCLRQAGRVAGFGQPQDAVVRGDDGMLEQIFQLPTLPG